MSKLFEIPEVQRLSLRGLLPKDLLSKISKMIKSCNTCQKNSPLKPTTQGTHFSCSAYKKMSRIAIDYLESLRPDAEGNDMIVVIIDCFSRFICLYPVKSKGTEIFLYAYLNWIGMGFGDPSEILADRGSQFTSRLTIELANAVGHNLTYTTAGSKEENSIVERANREVMRHLRNIIMDKRAIDEWAKNVPLVQRIMNSMVHSSTGVRPCSIIYSEEIDPSIIRSGNLSAKFDQTLENIPGEEGKDEQSQENIPGEEASRLLEWEVEWLERLKSAQKIYIERAIESLTEMDEKKRSRAPTDITIFKIGDLVLSEQGSSFRRGPESKLLPLLAGPFEVIKKEKDIYSLRNTITNKVRDIHVSKLHSYRLEEPRHTIESAAITDYADMYIVDHIVDAHPRNKIIGNIKLRDLKFLVRWLGYGKQSDTWQTWGTLRKNPLLKIFLEQHAEKAYNNMVKELPLLENQEEEGVEIED